MDEYRAKGKCFLCSKVGHITKDCPKRNSAKPTLSSSSINFAKLERMYDAHKNIEVNNIDIDYSMCKKDTEGEALELNAIKKQKPKQITEIEQHSATPKDIERRIVPAIVVDVSVNRHLAQALLDSGSLGDFVSTTLVDQLKLPKAVLAKPMGLSMAVAGYQEIDKEHYLNVVNLELYDLILGTPFMFKHGVSILFNPNAAKVISSCATEIVEENLEKLREVLRKESEDVCKKASETPLPPLRVINHRIPTIDNNKSYSWRISCCPDALRGQWEEKLNAYINSGRWEYATGKNAIPMLLIPKKGLGGVSLRTVLDKREQNANTYKLASPLPDIQEILWKVSQYKFKSLIDSTDAYEQIRIEPKDVPKSIFTTPSGTMISHVMQQGDCNAGATYQLLMNSIFSKQIGLFMHVFLDDIVIFTNTIEEHMQRIREVLGILRKEKLYLSPKKMQFFAKELHILGHIIDDKGILMDPHKVDSVNNWKTPNSKEQLMSFLGAVGYLAPNCGGIRIPMGVLMQRATINKNWRWDATAQRAFDEVKETVEKWRNHHRAAIDYLEGAPRINLVTDASCTGASGVLSQGDDPKTAKIAMFWSAKFTATQQNYPVHELELLAIKELMQKFQYQLHGVQFCVFTDNKSLEHLLTQKNLSARQARWLEFINQFDFDIVHIPGVDNKVADALSRIYADEPEGMTRAESKYMPEEDRPNQVSIANTEYDLRAPLTVPLYNPITGPETNADKAMADQSGTDNAEHEAGVEPESQPPVTDPDLADPAPRQSNREQTQVQKFSPTMEATHHCKKGYSYGRNKQTHGNDNRKSGTKQKALDAELNKRAAEPAELETEQADDPAAHVRKEKKILKESVKDDERVTMSTTYLDDIRNKYESDNQFSKVIKNPSHFKNFEVIDG
ncbi:Transposon Ty3-I Gag-Pol polyprotein [Ceratobasidium sp. AG-Ba]|nr:Transposon Ty3-I Gag-Pol polyprotein [Ceratobasidium sp. AG-Ba]